MKNFSEMAALGGAVFTLGGMGAGFLAPDPVTAELWLFHGLALAALWFVISGIAELRSLVWRCAHGLERPE